MAHTPFHDRMPAAITVSLACALVGCGVVGTAPPATIAIYATTVSGMILALPETVSGALQPVIGLGRPTSVAGPAGSQGLAIEALSPQHYALYVSDPAANAIRVYTIGPSSDQPAPAGIGPFPLGSGDGSPGGMTTTIPGWGGPLYVATSTGMIAGFNVDGASGALTPVPGSPFPAGPGIAQMRWTQAPAVTPLAQPAGCLYASDNTDPNGAVSAFKLGSGSGLVPAAGSPFATVPGGGPTALDTVWETSGTSVAEFLYVGLANAGAIAGFSVAPNCSLAPLAGSPFPADSGIESLLGGGATLSAVNSVDGTISTFAIDGTTGALTLIATVPVSGVAGSGAVIEVPGLILLPNSSSNNLTALRFSTSAQGSVAAAPPTASPFYAGAGTLALTFLMRPATDPP